MNDICYAGRVLSGKRNVTVWRPSVCLLVCPVVIFTATHQGAAYDAASVYISARQ